MPTLLENEGDSWRLRAWGSLAGPGWVNIY